jgi:ParB-like chromosome segregation protein Spo0J
LRGERRFRASQRAGRESIPAIVREIADEEMLEIALIENLQREDLNAIEEALGYQRLIEELRYTHERLSERVGKNRTSITNGLRLLTLPSGVQTMVSRGTMSAGHARALLGLQSSAEIEASARYVVDMGLSVRKTEALVARKLRRKVAARKARASGESQSGVDAVSSNYAEWTNELRRRLRTHVRIVRSRPVSGAHRDRVLQRDGPRASARTPGGALMSNETKVRPRSLAQRVAAKALGLDPSEMDRDRGRLRNPFARDRSQEGREEIVANCHIGVGSSFRGT